jgi:hypothetical protein
METEFNEKQRFKQLWVWLTLAASVLLILGIGIFAPKSEETAATVILLSALGLNILIILLMLSTQLTTHINHEGIFYKMSPFHRKFRFIDWDEVYVVYIRQYEPVKEYGGWGLRYSTKNGRAFNIAGNMGLQIVLNDHTKILLGTQQVKALQAFLQQNPKTPANK